MERSSQKKISCGKYGRRARQVIRDLLGKKPPQVNPERALRHVEGCFNCRGQIDSAIFKARRTKRPTTYRGRNASETLTEARRALAELRLSNKPP